MNLPNHFLYLNKMAQTLLFYLDMDPKALKKRLVESDFLFVESLQKLNSYLVRNAK